VSPHQVITPAKDLKATSSLVRRLINPKRDSAKKRICQWLSEIDDRRLLQFGLSPEDIAVLRKEQASMSGFKEARECVVGSQQHPEDKEVLIRLDSALAFVA
jgi:hypothetical protein